MIEGDYSIGPGKARNKILCILSAFTYLAISNKKTLSCVSFLIPHVVKPSFFFPVPHSPLFQVLPSPLILSLPFPTQFPVTFAKKEREFSTPSQLWAYPNACEHWICSSVGQYLWLPFWVMQRMQLGFALCLSLLPAAPCLRGLAIHPSVSFRNDSIYLW